MIFSKENLTIPNFLSLSRLVFLPLLYVFVNRDMQTAFLIGYVILALTDYLDGIIARRFNMTSPLGTFMDSIADVPFYLSTIYFIYKLHPEILRQPNFTLLIIGVSTVALSFIVSLILFGKPVMMHTTVMRLPSFFVPFLIVLAHFIDATYFLSFILLIYIAGFAEEIVIFFRFGLVHLDSKSYYHILHDLDPHV